MTDSRQPRQHLVLCGPDQLAHIPRAPPARRGRNGAPPTASGSLRDAPSASRRRPPRTCARRLRPGDTPRRMYPRDRGTVSAHPPARIRRAWEDESARLA